MPGTDNDIKKSRRVSFALPNSPGSSASRSRTFSYSNSSPPSRTNKAGNTSNTSSTSTKNNYPTTAPAPQTGPVPDNTTKDPFAGGPDPFVHTVTNTPHGLVIDGVLHPRNKQTGVSDISTPHQPQPFHYPPHNPSLPPFLQSAPHSYQVNMSTVGGGAMPDPNAQHFQPPVPDTTYGPYQYTYVPRSDPVAPQFMYPANGSTAFCAPGAVPFPQVQPQTPSPMPAPVMSGIPMIFYMNASENSSLMGV